MNGKSIYHTRATTDIGTDRQDHRQTEKASEESGRNVEGTWKGSKHILRNGTKPRTDSIGRFSDRPTRTGIRYVGYRATERVSAFWYALATFDLILAIILLWCVVITDTRTLEAPALRIEHIYRVPVYDSGEHTEMVDVETLLDESKVYMLAKIIHGESGSNWCSDQMQLYVGSVFLNRVSSSDFPNTFEEVAFQDNGRQYSCTRKGGGYWEEPTERDILNATFLMMNGSQLDPAYVWQSQFKQGHDIIKVQNMYFGKK